MSPRSRAPRRVANRTPEATRERVLDLREQLTARGDDAGADTTRLVLADEGTLLGRSTVWRILKAADAISPQPQKRPRSSWMRLAADRPNELWQFDV